MPSPVRTPQDLPVGPVSCDQLSGGDLPARTQLDYSDIRSQFKYIHKDPQIYVKFLSNKGVDKIREIRGLNRALALLAKTMAGIPDSKLTRGKIIDGSSDDAGRIVELLNSNGDNLPLSPVWKIEDLKTYLEEGIKYFKSQDEPLECGIKLKLLYSVKRTGFTSLLNSFTTQPHVKLTRLSEIRQH